MFFLPCQNSQRPFDTFPNFSWDNLWSNLGYILWDSAFCVCGFALAGDEKKLKIALALLKVQEQAFCLGFKKDEPRTFIALCA